MPKTNNSDPAQSILIAAKQLFIDKGISKTSMRDLANTAGVARSTLYLYYTNKEDVLITIVKQEMEAANSFIGRKLTKYSEPADIIVEGLILALKEIPKRPILQAVYASDDNSSSRRIVWGSQIIVDFGEQLMEHVIQPALEHEILQNKVDPDIMVEWVYRILLSFLTLPSNWIKNDKELRATLHALLVPVLLR